MKSKADTSADWLAISLHFGFGFIVGVLYSLTEIRTSYTHEQAIPFVIISGLMCGSLAGLLGDDAWGIHHHIIPNFAIKHSILSRAVLWTIFGISSITIMFFIFLK